MTTYYISTAGLDTNDGSISNPVLTIQKAISLCSNGSTIIFTTGTYEVSSLITIQKNITLSASTSVTISGSNIFEVKNNVVFNGITFLCTNTAVLVSIDCITSFTYCIFNHTNNALTLNGAFTISNCKFNSNATLNTPIIIYLCTDSFISDCYFSSQNVDYFIKLTNNIMYSEYMNSKKNLTINNNDIVYAGTNSMSFIYIDYFNQYSSTFLSYNDNTKMSLNIYSNTFNSSLSNSAFVVFNINNANDFKSVGVNRIYSNTINGTDKGVLHLDKKVNNTMFLLSELNLNKFKIYNNISNTIITSDSSDEWGTFNYFIWNLQYTTPNVNNLVNYVIKWIWFNKLEVVDIYYTRFMTTFYSDRSYTGTVTYTADNYGYPVFNNQTQYPADANLFPVVKIVQVLVVVGINTFCIDCKNVGGPGGLIASLYDDNSQLIAYTNSSWKHFTLTTTPEGYL